MKNGPKQKYTRITPAQFLDIARLHHMWSQGEAGGKKATLDHVWVSDLSASNLNLSRATLRHCKFERCVLSIISFASADVAGTEFTRCEIEQADFVNAYMAGCRVFRTSMSRCTFIQTNLHRCQIGGDGDSTFIEDSVFSNVSLSLSTIRRVRFTSCLLESVRLKSAKLSSAEFLRCTLIHCNMSRMVFTGGEFRASSLLRGALELAVFSRSSLVDTSLANCDFSRSKLMSVSVNEVSISFCILSLAKINNLNGHRLSITASLLQQASFTDTRVSLLTVSECELSGARGAESLLALSSILPAGDLIVYKKARAGRVVQLMIPTAADRSHAEGRKCRASYAMVMSITSASGKNVKTARSLHDDDFVYTVGEKATPTSYDTDRWSECAPGIHFFLTKQEAMEYGK